MASELLGVIKESVAAGAYIMTQHALRQADERHIAVTEIEQALLSAGAEVIEDYPNDRRGPSCLVLGATPRGRMLHIQVTYPPRVWVITVYEPSDEKWVDPKTRR